MGGKRKTRIVKLLKTEYRIGDIVPASAIYECSECENIAAFKKGETFLPCEEDHPDDDQHWYRTNQFVHFVSKNVNTEFEKLETVSLRLTDKIAETAGNIWFVYLHIAWYGLWIWLNTGHSLFGLSNIDTYPSGHRLRNGV